MQTTYELFNVIDKTGKQLAPCTARVAWVLISRKRAVQMNETTIKIIMTKKDIKANKRLAIQRDGRICHYCGKYILESEIATADHILAKQIKNGIVGYDDVSNLVCACFTCNNHKGNTDYEEYIIFRLSLACSIIAVFLHTNSEDILHLLIKLFLEEK